MPPPPISCYSPSAPTEAKANCGWSSLTSSPSLNGSLSCSTSSNGNRHSILGVVSACVAMCKAASAFCSRVITSKRGRSSSHSRRPRDPDWSPRWVRVRPGIAEPKGRCSSQKIVKDHEPSISASTVSMFPTVPLGIPCQSERSLTNIPIQASSCRMTTSQSWERRDNSSAAGNPRFLWFLHCAERLKLDFARQ